jgi:hypothetical protein
MFGPGMKIARRAVISRTAVELHPKVWAIPPQTPKIQRSLFARFMPMLNPRCPAAKSAILGDDIILNRAFCEALRAPSSNAEPSDGTTRRSG